VSHARQRSRRRSSPRSTALGQRRGAARCSSAKPNRVSATQKVFLHSRDVLRSVSRGPWPAGRLTLVPSPPDRRCPRRPAAYQSPRAPARIRARQGLPGRRTRHLDEAIAQELFSDNSSVVQKCRSSRSALDAPSRRGSRRNAAPTPARFAAPCKRDACLQARCLIAAPVSCSPTYFCSVRHQPVLQSP
jgi:hypothetical protein